MLCLSPSTRDLEFIHRALTKHQLCKKLSFFLCEMRFSPRPWVYNLIITTHLSKYGALRILRNKQREDQWEFRKAIFLFLATRWKRFPSRVTDEFGVSVNSEIQELHNGQRQASERQDQRKSPPPCTQVPSQVLLPCSSFPITTNCLVPLQAPVPSLPCYERMPSATAIPNATRQGRSNSTCPKWGKPGRTTSLVCILIRTGHLQALQPFKNVTCGQRMT